MKRRTPVLRPQRRVSAWQAAPAAESLAGKPRTGEGAPAVSLDRAVALGHRPGTYALGSAAIQRHSFEDFETYSEAKAATIYSQELLDEQKDDKIDWHFDAAFSPEQREAIYRINREHYGEDEIISDGDGETELVLQDTSRTPHIDHRFPKSRGGTNSFRNAAVLPAKANMRKGQKLEIDRAPTDALSPYRGLVERDRDFTVGKFMGFSAAQRELLLEANQKHYGKGMVISDGDGRTPLPERFDSTRIPNVDHITPKSKGGSNYYFNAQVLPARVNIQKGGRKRGSPDIDYEIGEMSLVEYYRQKSEPESSESEVSSDESSSETTPAPPPTKRRRKNTYRA